MVELREIVNKEQEKKEKNEIKKTYKELKEQVKKELRDKKFYIGEWVYTIFFMIITFFIVGLPSLFEFGWDWSIYESQEFWINYLTVQVASWFTRVWVLALKTRRNKELNTNYTKSSDTIQHLIDKDSETPFIDYNCMITNRERKIRVWKNKQILKILKVAKKGNVGGVLHTINNIENINIEEFLIKNDIRTHIKNKIRLKWKLWRLNKHQTKIRKLLKTITNEYINTNFDNLKVKYNKESRAVLTVGYAPKKEKEELGVSYKKHKGRKFLNETIPAFMMTSSIMFLIVPLVGQANYDSWNAWYKFITNCFIVFSSSIMMYWKADDIFKETDLRVLLARENTLKRFSNRLEPPKEKTSPLQENKDMI